MKTAIVILNYNNWEDTINCINSVLRYNTAEIKIFVVDNGSTNNSVHELDKYFNSLFGSNYSFVNDTSCKSFAKSKLIFFANKDNVGYARGNNLGAELACQDDDVQYIMILNNDILFVEDIIPGLLKSKSSLSNCAIISPILFKKDMQGYDYNCARRNVTSREIIWGFLSHYFYRVIKKTPAETRQLLRKYEGRLPSIIPIDLPSGSCMLINKNLFINIGMFDPETFLYYEENILCKKVQKLGLANYMDTTLSCVHLGASATSKSSSLFIVDTNIRSALYYMKKYSGCSNTTYWFALLTSKLYRSMFVLQKWLMKK